MNQPLFQICVSAEKNVVLVCCVDEPPRNIITKTTTPKYEHNYEELQECEEEGYQGY